VGESQSTEGLAVKFGPQKRWQSHRTPKKLEGEDLEVALAGEDYGEEAAVGGEGVFADG